MTQPPAPPTAPDLGLMARAIGMITSPKATFETVVAHPKPVAMLFLVCLILGLAAGLPQLTERGKLAALDMQVKQVEAFGMQVTPEMYQQMERRAGYGAYTTMIGMFVGLPLMTLLFTALYWAIFNAILGGMATFKQVMAVVTHSQVIAALGAVVSAPIMYAQGVMSQAGPFHLGALVPFLDPNSVIARTLGATNIFTLWGMMVTGIGLGVLYRRKGTTIGVVLIVLYLVIAAAFFAAFSGFGRS